VFVRAHLGDEGRAKPWDTTDASSGGEGGWKKGPGGEALRVQKKRKKGKTAHAEIEDNKLCLRKAWILKRKKGFLSVVS